MAPTFQPDSYVHPRINSNRVVAFLLTNAAENEPLQLRWWMLAAAQLEKLKCLSACGVEAASMLWLFDLIFMLSTCCLEFFSKKP